MATPTAKKELIQTLVKTYGYEEEDIKMLTNGKLQGMINQEEKDLLELEQPTFRVERKKDKIKDSDLITFMNARYGGLYYKSSHSGQAWDLKRWGQEDSMEFGEMKRMHNQYPTFLKDCWMIVLDNDAQEYFKLTKIYENIIMPENIDGIFKKDVAELSEFIDKLPSGMQSTVAGRAMELYKADGFDSIKVKRMIEEKFNFSLDDNAPLNDTIILKKSE